MTYKEALLKKANLYARAKSSATIGNSNYLNDEQKAQLIGLGYSASDPLFKNRWYQFWKKRTPILELRIATANRFLKDRGYNISNRHDPLVKRVRDIALYKGKYDQQNFLLKAIKPGPLKDPGIPKLLNPKLAPPEEDRKLMGALKQGRIPTGTFNWIKATKEIDPKIGKDFIRFLNKIVYNGSNNKSNYA